LIACSRRYYIIGDYVLHFCYKVCRSDTHVWLAVPKKASLAVSIIVRIITKILVDFTGMAVIRLPIIQGGAYWSGR
jgi:hypothetical protein